jgi:hypothetical protein
MQLGKNHWTVRIVDSVRFLFDLQELLFEIFLPRRAIILSLRVAARFLVLGDLICYI